MAGEGGSHDIGRPPLLSPREILSSATDFGTKGAATASWTEEVRVAMAWNGGVSLAVWMGGVAVELDAARAAKPLDRKKIADESLPSSTGSVAELYQAICQAFDRRLVVDIIAGASAGGLNGAMLAGVIAHDKELTPDFLRQRWLDIGDFGTLLQPLDKQDPSSIMQGQEFYNGVRDAFTALLGTDGPPTDANCQERVPVLLDVQATDVLGEEKCFVDVWGLPFYAREYRAPLRFRASTDYIAGTLAAAARASASFPGAFEPQKLTGEASRLAGFPGKVRWAIDGGLLENAPIKPAIELIPRRYSIGPVKRFVCYVNASLTAHTTPDDDPGQPSLAQVISYTINLPRDGRVIDQLTAMEDASRRAGSTADAGRNLFCLPPDESAPAAAALLTTYQRRRGLLSLDDLFGASSVSTRSGPGRAQQIVRQLTLDYPKLGVARLPWIPENLKPPASPADWGWGVRPAQRVLQLELDVLDAALKESHDPNEAASIFDHRSEIEHALIALDAVYDDFIDPDGPILAVVNRLDCPEKSVRERAIADLQQFWRGIAETTYGFLTSGTRAFYETYRSLADETLEWADLPKAAEVWGSSEHDRFDLALRGLLRRALPIEVIRRSFADDLDIESAEDLSIAQLTPLIPTALLTLNRDYPNPAQPSPQAPGTEADKLCGVRLNHFAGFYRASWRANDFMWGRLDGAAAISRMLVDPDRASQLHSLTRFGSDRLESAARLTSALLPDDKSDDPGNADRRRLIWELLPPKEGEKEPPETSAELKERLETALTDDLVTGDGELTRAICARALQYEIVVKEAPIVAGKADEDRVAGAYATEVGWPATVEQFWPVIEELRQASARAVEIAHEENAGKARSNRKPVSRGSLPVRLGCDDPDEATSTLGLRTIAHALLVVIAALGGAFPLTKLLQPVRLPLLSVDGMAARRAGDRIAVVVGFCGASWYLAARWITLQHTDVVPLRTIWSAPTLALVVCILAVIGVVAVPALRTLRTKRWTQRGLHFPIALALLATGGGVALGYQWQRQGMIEALATWHAAYTPPEALLWVVVAAGGFHVASSLDTFLRYAKPLLAHLGRWISLTSLVLGGIGVALAYYSARYVLVTHLSPFSWRTVLSILAFAGPIVLFIYLGLAAWPRRAAEMRRARQSERASEAPLSGPARP